MLAFLGSQRSYASEVQLPLPLGVDISCWLKEICTAYDKCNVRRETVHLGASRVVDVASVLKLARYRGEGTANIRVDDPICPWNDRILRVEFDETCRSVTEAEDWDIRLGIDAFTALILGGRELSQVCYMDGVEIRGNMENLQKIFYIKPLWIGDSF
jgi:predicted acetyltransferase